MKHFSIKVANSIIHLQLVLLPLVLTAQFDSLPNFRYYDKRGINVFEAPKHAVKHYKGLKFRLGASMAQSFQSLSHSNSEAGKASNALYGISPGFNTAMANLSMDVQLTAGMRFNLVTYLSTRHHNETRLKAGYLQIDKLPLDGEFWDRLMKVMTIKLGHMEINYGDAHFRRSDGGQVIYNSFMDNYILDAYTTETGAEFYGRKKCFFAMAGISSGTTKGNVDSVVPTPYDGNVHKSPSIYLKAGVDKTVGEWLRARLSASFYHNGSSAGNTLFNGDRAGSNYFMVMEKAGTGVTYATNAFSGRLDPEFTKKVNAFQFNAFIKLISFELFATYDVAGGRTANEESVRYVKQLAIDWVFRFGGKENTFIGSRYNIVTARLPGIAENVKIDRVVMAFGYFFTNNILIKCELSDQLYKNFPLDDYRNEGRFKGFMVQAVISF
jgi:hypothetical protein